VHSDSAEDARVHHLCTTELSPTLRANFRRPLQVTVLLQVTVRTMLQDHCPVCLSVTFVYCGQTAVWIKMPLGTDVGLGPGNIVSHGDPAPPTEWGTTAPSALWPMTIVAKWLDASGRDVNETLAYETETFGFSSETRPRPRPSCNSTRPRRDRDV